MANKNLLPPYTPISTEFLGEQKVRVILDLQNVSSYRCNLVAASKRFNYLFIALRSQISVYKPMYPHQTFPETPHTILRSDPIAPSNGHIDHSHPHAINTLTIGDLGSEEVLISAHDDGDICVWYTRDLKRMALRLSVGQSAWGVALHKERRLLAVSANSHLITVFELGVGKNEQAARDERGQDGEDLNEEEDEAFVTAGIERGEGAQRRRNHSKRLKRHDYGIDTDWDAVGGEEIQGGRHEEHRHLSVKKSKRLKTEGTDQFVKVLAGHENNIPSISFLDDDTGRWLVGTSIDGMVILWDVHTQRMVEKCRLGFIHTGWSVVFLTPQSFKPANNMYEVLDKLPSHMLRRSRQHFFPDSVEEQEEIPSRVYVSGVRSIATGYYSQPVTTRNRVSEARAWDISPAINEYWIGEGQVEGMPAPAPDIPPSPLLIPTAPTPVDDPDEGDNGNGESETSSVDSESVLYQQESLAGALFDRDPSWTSTLDSEEFTDDDSNSAEGIENTPGNISNVLQSVEFGQEALHFPTTPARRLGREFVQTQSTNKSSEDQLPEGQEPEPAQPPKSFIFCTTEKNAYLLPTSLLSPTVVCQKFLHQTFPPPDLQYLDRIDRLSIVLAIPELSLIVAASQKGRVGLFRLTRSGEHFGMRLDAVLPHERGLRDLQNDVDVDTRPAAALLGMSVSPVQGKEMGMSRGGSDASGGTRRRKERRRGGGWRGVEGRRRWRLVLVYMNGHILTYELGRNNDDEGTGGLGDLLGIGGFVVV